MKNDVNSHTTVAELSTNLTVPEMAVFLRISRSAAYALANQKGFPAKRIGRRIIVSKSKLIAWLENNN